MGKLKQLKQYSSNFRVVKHQSIRLFFSRFLLTKNQ